MNDFATTLYAGELAPEGTVIESYCGVQGRSGYNCPNPPGEPEFSVIPGTEYTFYSYVTTWRILSLAFGLTIRMIPPRVLLSVRDRIFSFNGLLCV